MALGTPRIYAPFELQFGFVNQSPTNAVGVRVTNSVPPEFAVTTITPQADGAACTLNGREVACLFAFTSPGATSLVSLTLISSATGLYSNYTAMPRVLPESNLTNNTAFTPVVVRPPLVHITGLTVREASGATDVAEISLESSNRVPVSVEFRTVDGTAVGGRNYVPRQGTIVFSPGVTRLPVAVTLIDNALDEVDPRFFVELTNALDADLSPGQSLGQKSVPILLIKQAWRESNTAITPVSARTSGWCAP